MAANRDESKAAGQAPKARTRTSRPRNTSSEPTVPARPVRRAMTLAELNEAAAAPTSKTRANVAPRTAAARTTAARRRPAANAKAEAPAAAPTVETPAAAPVAAAPVKKAPAKRGPRRATSAVTSPVASTDAPVGLIEPAPVAASAAEPAVEAPAKVEEKAEAKAPAKRPTRSRSRRASAPAGDAAGTPAKEAAVAAPVAEVPVVETAVVEASVVEVTEEVVVVAEAPVEASAEVTEEAPAEAPAKTARKRPTRSSRSAKAPAAEVVAEAPAEVPAVAASIVEAVAAEAMATGGTESAGITDPFAIPEMALSVLFQAPDLSAVAPVAADEDEDEDSAGNRRNRRSRSRTRTEGEAAEGAETDEDETDGDAVVSRRRRRRRRGEADLELAGGEQDDPPNTITRVRAPRTSLDSVMSNKVTAVKGSTRLEAKRQRRRDSRESGRRRQVITEAEFLARRESVDRQMIVRQREDRIQIGVLEDGILAEHFVSKTQQDSLIGNVYIGKVQNVLPSMEAAFVDIGRGRNAVLYAGEVNWDVAGLDGQPRRIEHALKSGDTVLVQVTKDPVGHKGARLTSQISLPGRYLVYVPGGSMTGISRKLPDVERNRLKKILKDHLPENAGVIVRTAAEGASEEELMNDINRLRAQWEGIEAASTSTKTLAPELLYGEPDLTIKVVRDVFNEDFTKLIVSGNEAWDTIEAYVTYVAPDLISRLEKWESNVDIFSTFRIDEQIHKALDRKVFLPSGGSLVIDRTEAMTVVDVNTGKFTGSGGNLEETVTKNNLEAAEEVVRQLRLRDIGGIIVIDFIDMVLESNRDLVLRRLVECLGRDRTKHQVAEVTSLGLVQMTRKRMGTGLLEVFGENCEACNGRGVITHDEPVEHRRTFNSAGEPHVAASRGQEKPSRAERRRRNRASEEPTTVEHTTEAETEVHAVEPEANEAKATAARTAFANIAAAAHAAHEHEDAAAEAAGATLTVGGEQVVVPNARRRRAGSEASAPELTLENLEAALPDNSPVEDAESHDAGGHEDAQGATRAPRSRSRRKSRSKAPAPEQASQAPEQAAPVISGVAGQASAAAPSEAKAVVATSKTSGIEPVARVKRSRRATSPQGGSDAAVSVASDTLATPGSAHVASLADIPKAAQPLNDANAPIMLGVGVPVNELK
ncbi:Rne/Rng family ribonuclease [Paeniglutamicibacter kerguelensis]|uniref:Ribonuclease E n=1 Tax=Paeniglutamicibacter kerguelensis TaxID=254788 RepID=A0ABS4XD22_9MICC|nr:Rne/Rng family ribonuclease [Paeniglutamicibacter kerguelensis]MBP2386372.1 ribonuclease E [Paeniglutamicibacter kerguelensis]